jgi:hypothetical protein
MRPKPLAWARNLFLGFPRMGHLLLPAIQHPRQGALRWPTSKTSAMRSINRRSLRRPASGRIKYVNQKFCEISMRRWCLSPEIRATRGSDFSRKAVCMELPLYA